MDGGSLKKEIVQRVECSRMLHHPLLYLPPVYHVYHSCPAEC